MIQFSADHISVAVNDELTLMAGVALLAMLMMLKIWLGR